MSIKKAFQIFSAKELHLTEENNFKAWRIYNDGIF